MIIVLFPSAIFILNGSLDGLTQTSIEKPEKPFACNVGFANKVDRTKDRLLRTKYKNEKLKKYFFNIIVGCWSCVIADMAKVRH